ncbi:MAG: hypothetical protein CNLJKLNK_00471 [Holosporales bacterium]
MKYLSVFTILASLVLQNHATGAQGTPMGGNMGAFGVSNQSVAGPHLSSSSATAAAPASVQGKVRITGAELAEYVRRYEDAESLDWLFLSGFSVSGVLDLSGLTKVTKIDSNFLNYHLELTKVILPPHLTCIGMFFLIGCTGLTAIDLSFFAQITKIRSEFLSGCTGLTAIDLSPLAGVKSVDSFFLIGCTGLTAIDLSPLAGVKSVGRCFLRGCTGLRTVILPSTRAFRGVVFGPYITTILADLMLMNDGRLELLHPRVNCIRSIVTEQGANILGLRKVIVGNLAPLAQVKKLCPQFLDHVRDLFGLDLSPLEEVDEIGDGFLSWNTDLEKLEI